MFLFCAGDYLNYDLIRIVIQLPYAQRALQKWNQAYFGPLGKRFFFAMLDVFNFVFVLILYYSFMRFHERKPNWTA